MNQDIFNQLAQEQDNFNAYQDRFKNELSNFDMDKRTQQITQQASCWAPISPRPLWRPHRYYTKVDAILEPKEPVV